MTEHPKFKDLQILLKAARMDLLVDWEGPVYRCVSPKWAHPDVLVDGKGSFKTGSRWMRPGVSPAVYAATSELIALKESRRTVDHFGIPSPKKNAPRMIVQLDAKLEGVADLCQMDAILPWPTQSELLAENWESQNEAGRETLAQAFGRALFALKLKGLIIPSARDRRGRNLIWFPENFEKSDQITIVGKDELENWIAR